MKRIKPLPDNNGNNWYKCTFKLSSGVFLRIVHNLPEIQGINVNAAFQNWLVRTDEYTEQSLCEYIEDKAPEFVALPQSEYYRRVKQSKDMPEGGPAEGGAMFYPANK